MTGSGTDVFQILEIEPTEDKRAVRKAYAQLVKKYHPEEQPEKWKEIHDAYEAALRIAEQGEAAHGSGMPEADADAQEELAEMPKDVPPDGKAETSEDAPLDGTQTEQEEMTALFRRINEIASGQREQKQRQEKEFREEKTRQVIKIVTDMLEKKMFSRETWSILLEQEDIFSLLCSKEFLYAFGDCFQGKRIPPDLYHYLRKQIVRIQNYDEEKRMEAGTSMWETWDGLEDAAAYAAGKIDASHYANIGKQRKEQDRRKKKEKIWAVLVAFLLFIALMMIVFGIIFLFFIK